MWEGVVNDHGLPLDPQTLRAPHADACGTAAVHQKLGDQGWTQPMKEEIRALDVKTYRTIVNIFTSIHVISQIIWVNEDFKDFTRHLELCCS